MNRPSLMERWAWSRSREKGTALLIALFALLLVAVIAMALIVSSGTETALVDNYHSATSAYFSALAGLEEGRGRLSSKSPDYLNAVPGSLPSPLPLDTVLYIRNPSNGETVDPTDLSAGNSYADNEYAKEFLI